MFPVIEEFISDTYITNNAPVRIGYELQKEIEAKANKVLALVKRGNRGLVFPNIMKIKKIMIEEKRKNNSTTNR